jgi:hypothetical protein
MHVAAMNHATRLALAHVTLFDRRQLAPNTAFGKSAASGT